MYNECYAPKYGMVHSDEIYSCLELNLEEYRLFGHAMNRPTAKYMCNQRETIVFGQRAKKHVFSQLFHGILVDSEFIYIPSLFGQ